MSLAEFEALIQAGIPNHKACSVMERIREKEAEGLTFDEAVNATDEIVATRTQKQKAAMQTELDTVAAEIRTIKEKSNLQSLLDRKKSLNEELAKLHDDPQANGEADDEAPEPSDEPGTDVRQHLKDALTSLGEAFTGFWPEEDPDDLDEIRDLAQKCENKLAEIVAKVKEILDDVEEPVDVSSVERAY